MSVAHSHIGDKQQVWAPLYWISRTWSRSNKNVAWARVLSLLLLIKGFEWRLEWHAPMPDFRQAGWMARNRTAALSFKLIVACSVASVATVAKIKMWGDQKARPVPGQKLERSAGAAAKYAVSKKKPFVPKNTSQQQQQVTTATERQGCKIEDRKLGNLRTYSRNAKSAFISGNIA